MYPPYEMPEDKYRRMCNLKGCHADATWIVPQVYGVAKVTCNEHLARYVPSEEEWRDAAERDRRMAIAKFGRREDVGPGWVDDGAGCVEFIPE